MAPPVRVLVVDDSAFARKVLREVLAKIPGVEVVGIAGDGFDALEKIAQLKPDVITLDLVMPHLDGLGVLRELAALGNPAKVIVVSISDQDSELAVEALQLGAVDLVRKPTALATDRLYEVSDDLPRKILAAAAARAPRLGRPAAASPVRLDARACRVQLVVVGTSTGGPQALTRLLTSLPAEFPAPIAVALHIPADYTAALAQRLDQACEIDVHEASDGIELRPGRAVLAQGGIHLRAERTGGRLLGRLSHTPASSLHHPSVDVLFESAAKTCGADTIGVVLTGMGDDGLLGSHAIVKAGGLVLTETESSCVVYGMPRCVHEAGLSSAEARIEMLGSEIVARLFDRT